MKKSNTKVAAKSVKSTKAKATKAKGSSKSKAVKVVTAPKVKPMVQCTEIFAATAQASGAVWVRYAGKPGNLFAVGSYKTRDEATKGKAADARVAKLADVTMQTIAPAGDAPGMLHKSTIESPCYVVWDTADKMSKTGARRKDIINACIKQGVAFYTARTQYQLWYASKKG